MLYIMPFLAILATSVLARPPKVMIQIRPRPQHDRPPSVACSPSSDCATSCYLDEDVREASGCDDIGDEDCVYESPDYLSAYVDCLKYKCA